MAANNLANCLPVTLAYEGGLSLARSDPGNWTGGKVGVGALKGTKYGIAASTHPNTDIAALTLPAAQAIYEREYWSEAGCEALPPGLDLSHFDGTVNSGLGHSAAWLRRALKAPTAVDRVHGYAAARLTSLHSFKAWATFGRGWAARIAGVEARAVAMAVGPEQARATIAGAAATASATARAAAAVAHAGTAGAAGGIAVAASGHPATGAAISLLAAVAAVWTAFRASMSGARAAALAAHAAA